MRIPSKAKILEWSLVASNFMIVLFLLVLMLLMNMASPLYLFLELLFPVISVGILKKIEASIIANIVASFSLFLDFLLSSYFLLFNSSPTLVEVFSLALGGFISFLNLLLCILSATS
ncbi:MAG: hypothetical protein ACP5KW_02725 [Thermoproteota archaeon]